MNLHHSKFPVLYIFFMKWNNRWIAPLDIQDALCEFLIVPFWTSTPFDVLEFKRLGQTDSRLYASRRKFPKSSKLVMNSQTDSQVSLQVNTSRIKS